MPNSADIPNFTRPDPQRNTNVTGTGPTERAGFDMEALKRRLVEVHRDINSLIQVIDLFTIENTAEKALRAQNMLTMIEFDQEKESLMEQIITTKKGVTNLTFVISSVWGCI